MNLQPIPTSHAIGELFGFPIPEALFFGNPDFTEYLFRDALSDIASLQGHVSNTLSYGYTSIPQTSTVVSPEVVGDPQGQVWADRIENRLLESERRAYTPIQKEEYQLARRILRRVFYDNCTNAYFLAFCWMYGGSPEIIARKQEHYRQFMLRGSALKLDSSALPPKKPVVSVTKLPAKEKKANG